MAAALAFFFLLFNLQHHVVLAAFPRAMDARLAPAQPPKPTEPPSKNDTRGSESGLERRQVTSILGRTCGYYDGDPKRSRTADVGYGCRSDIQNGLWGFCPTTVISASDCGMAGNCRDMHACKNGCGKTGIRGLTTFTCSSSNEYCSTVILEGDYEGGFSYIACGARAVTETLLLSPTIAAVPSVTVTPEPSASSESDTTNAATETGTSTPGASSLTHASTSPHPPETASLSTQLIPAASETSSRSAEDDDGGSSGGPSNIGIITGGVLGGIAIVCITVVVAVYLLRRNRSSDKIGGGKWSGFLCWGRPSKTPDYGPAEAALASSQLHYGVDDNKSFAGWAPAEVYGSDPWRRNQPAPVELPAMAPVELSGRNC